MVQALQMVIIKSKNSAEMPLFKYLITIWLAFLPALIQCQAPCNPLVCLCTSGTCTNCISSAFFISTNMAANTCQLCHYKCSTCVASNDCSICAPGYFKNSDGTLANTNGQLTSCYECPVFCSVCNAQASCIKCIDGYVAVNGICKPCALANVLSCQSQMTVFSCMPSFWKNGDSCSPCRQFCQSCTSSTNCLACADGFRVQISAGTYCSPCPAGCKTCSSSLICTACLKNYRIVSGLCINIQNQCKNIQNCQQCEYSSTNVLRCKMCSYPYYLLQSLNTCSLGASLLCRYGASGQTRYQCLNSCGQIADKIDSLGSQLVCSPKLWIPQTDIKQHYFQASNSWGSFLQKNEPYNVCGSTIPLIYSSQFLTTKSNIVTLNKVFKPYYKLIIMVKAIPIYKQVSQATQISLIVRMKDNSTSPLQYTETISTIGHGSCKYTYFTIQSRLIKDQNVTIQFESRLVSTLNSQSSFKQGLMGYSEILIQLYRCSSDCRVCSNSKYCIECYGNLFAYQNQCVNQCFGFYQFYAPSGDPNNYTYKSCLQKCPSRFYNVLHPSKPGVYICVLCNSPCLTCKSQSQCLSCITPYLYYDLGFICLLNCPNTHYNNTQINQCVPCNSPCRTCISQTQCTSCSIGFYFPLNNSCLGFCPQNYFSNITSRTCQPCDKKCIACTNSPTNCLSCSNGYFLLSSSCVLSCPNLTHYVSNNKCQICKPPCLQCIEQKKCLNCISGYFLNNWCFNSCPGGYYGNFTSNTCQKCTDSNCARCTSSTTCQACSNNTYLYNSQCVTLCPAKTYPSLDVNSSRTGNICMPCLQPCYQCRNSTYCISCQIGYLSKVSLGKCLNTCEKGYYASETINSSSSSNLIPNSTIKTCQICFSQCAQCKNFDVCLSCSDIHKILTPDRKCASSCPIGFYNHSRTCQLCNYPCLTCQNSAQACLSCYQPYILSGINCISQCGVAQYLYNQQCFLCKNPCRTCSSDTQCTSCQISTVANGNQTFLWNNSCLVTCPKGTYSDSITLKCRLCNYPCQTCQDSKKCITCITGYFNKQRKTCEMCTQTTFPNELTKQCEYCNQSIPNCKTCSSSTVCRYCQPSYFLYSSKCITQVQCRQISHSYPNSQQLICAICVPPCGQCISQNQCTTCLTGYLLNYKCLLQCPSGYYASITQNSCQLCDIRVCLTCNLGPTNCILCNTAGNKPILMPSLNTCISAFQCPNEFYIDQSFGYSRCIKCQSPCLTCTSSRICTSCLSGILYNGECKSSCPISFFEVQNNNNSQLAECLACSSNCLKCRIQPNYCVSCTQDKFLQASTCVDNCSDGFYLDSSTLQCKKCINPCKTCTSASTCLQCLQIGPNGNNLTNRIVYYGQCLEICPDNTYEVNKSCIKCPQQCQLCADRQIGTTNQRQIYCKKCSQGLFMNSTKPGKCQNKCQASEYPDIYTRSCYSCQFPCVTCSSATACRSCSSEYLIYVNDCVKGTLCPQGTFKSYSVLQNQYRCLDKCQPLFYGSNFSRQCLNQCPFNYAKFEPTSLCVKECPSGFYLSDDFFCKKCQSNSQSPNNQHSNNCSNLLKMNIKVKSIFNSLFIRLNFNQQVSLSALRRLQNSSDNSLIRVQYRPLSNIYQIRRLLQTSYLFEYEMNPIASTNTLWLKIKTAESLETTQINVALANQYIFTGKILQNANATAIISGFDKYTDQQIKRGEQFEIYAQIVSVVMCILFIINVGFNTGYLMYPMVDVYQLLFILLFLNVDYPPILNYFMFGFRYSHFLFLPQIFNTGKPTTTTANTPQKFGIVVPDANFLHNTGHHFLIMIIVIGVFGVLKLIDVVLKLCDRSQVRSNKIKNQSENSQDQNRNSSDNENNPNVLNNKQNQIQSYTNTNTQNQNKQKTEMVTQRKQTQATTVFPRIRKFMSIVLDRIRWNYFNDFLYIMYFYLMLFAFCQTYDMSAREGIDYASTVFSIIFIILGISWPIGLLAMLVYKNNANQIFKVESNSQHSQTPQQYSSEYKCYVANLKPKQSNIYGVTRSPIGYVKKLLLAMLFCFCSNYQNFIMGIITMLTIISIITILIYRPFKNRILLTCYCVFDGLLCVGCILLCILMMSGLRVNLSIEIKHVLAVMTVVVFLLLSLVLCVYNCAMIVLQTIQYFTSVNHLQKYDQADSDNGQDKQKMQGKAQDQGLQGVEADNENNSEQNSNMRLNIRLSKNRKYSNQVLVKSNANDRLSQNESDQSGGLDIYLKQNMNKVKAPKILIKCVKGAKFKQSENQHQQQAQYSDSSSQDAEYRDKHLEQDKPEVDSDYKKISYKDIKINNKAKQNEQCVVSQVVDSNIVVNPNIKEEQQNREQGQQEEQTGMNRNIFDQSPDKPQAFYIQHVVQLHSDEQSCQHPGSQYCPDNKGV